MYGESQAVVEQSEVEDPKVLEEHDPPVMDEAHVSGEEPTVEDLFGEMTSPGSDGSGMEHVWDNVSWCLIHFILHTV